MEPRVPVTFGPAETTVWVSPGTTIAAAARQAGVLLATPCGGRGVCGSCGVRVETGSLAPADAAELAGLKRAPEGVRLACRALVSEAVRVRPLVSYATGHTERRALAGGVELVAGIDLGTTSVAALLVEATSGRELARASVRNRQITFGADVLARMSAALSGSGSDLRRLAEESIAEALSQASSTAGVDLADVGRAMIAGNTVMAALLLGADVSRLSVHPFAIPEMSVTLPKGSAISAVLGADARIELVPPIAAFVGGDALAATVAAGLVDASRPTLLVDLGTNAEIVLAGTGPLITASTAAGPAFEGVGVSCGGPAASGAVDSVRINDSEVTLHVIGDTEPRWLSGSGIVSLVAALRGSQALGADGRLRSGTDSTGRFFADDAGVEWFGLQAGAAEKGGLAISQLDIRTFQLAKAAVRVGIQAVLHRARLSPSDLSEVCIAGAFGSAISPEDLVELGVLPLGSASRTRVVGNAALEGAAAMALDPGLMVLAARTARDAIHVDLAGDSMFGVAFVKATELDEWGT